MAKESNPMTTSANAVNLLIKEVAVAAGFPVSTPKHFDQLSQTIHARTGILLSATTLKRLWNYIDEPVSPRRSTLDTLARFCGWRSFAEFESGNIPDIESGNVGATTIRTDRNLLPGERVRLFWQPARVCEIEFIGKSSWKVVYSEGTRLKPGDTFSCPMIVSGEPLYIDIISHQGSKPGVYVCGRMTGVTFRRVAHPDLPYKAK